MHIIFSYGSWAMIYISCSEHFTSFVMNKVNALVHLRCYNKLSQTRWLMSNTYFSWFQKLERSPKLRHPQCLGGSAFWLIDGCVFSLCVLQWWKRQGSSLLSEDPPFRRTPTSSCFHHHVILWGLVFSIWICGSNQHSVYSSYREVI